MEYNGMNDKDLREFKQKHELDLQKEVKSTNDQFKSRHEGRSREEQ